MHKYQFSWDELFKETQRTSEIFLAFAELYKDIGFQVCKVVVFSRCFWDGAATKIPEKIKSVGFVSGARLYHEHELRKTTDNFIFEKKRVAR
jgi:hypothetical protein